MDMFRVHYIHNAPSDSYWVSRGFPTEKEAEEFISNNALVFPLPGPPWIEDMNDPNQGVTPDTGDHYPTTENVPGF